LISFDDFKTEDGSPIYLQIVRHVKRGVVAGTIRDGDEMPSRRMLSALLGVNPNTVQKAYRMLEEEGLVQSRAGAISCVALDAGAAERVRRELTESEARRFAESMRRMGLTKEETAARLDEVWGEDA
jgi:GntR family transcriptional regulator